MASPAILYSNDVYTISWGVWADMYDILYLPGARPGVLVNHEIFIPFDRKVPYRLKKLITHKTITLLREYSVWRCEQTTKGEIKNWKYLTRVAGVEKKKFVNEMLDGGAS